MVIGARGSARRVGCPELGRHAARGGKESPWARAKRAVAGDLFPLALCGARVPGAARGAVLHDCMNLFGPGPDMILLICSVGRRDDFINLSASGLPSGVIIK